MCAVLDVSTSGYYKWQKKKDEIFPEKEAHKKEIQQKIKKSFYESGGTYGSPRVHHDLVEWGYSISQKTVARMMQELRLRAIPEEKYVITTDSNHDSPIYSNLLNQEFTTEKPDKVWVSDITYVWTLEGWVYLSTIMDLFSRRIVGWGMDQHMKKELPLKVLHMAFTTRQPSKELIHHSDRGSQYCSNKYIEVLQGKEVQVSMSRKGNPYDNACIESFHATIKKELIHRRRFKTRAEAIKAINHYISHFYNENRKHSTLGYCSPNKFERTYWSEKQEKELII
jgi:putative transposase